jgi:putative ABC transport system ATP-binding protein
MPLLELEKVSKRYGSGSHFRVALSRVSLELEAGELVAVWGLRRSGRSTLLRVASGLEPPDAGVVRFEGRDLAAQRTELLGDGIGYCQRQFRAAGGQVVLDHMVLDLLARGATPSHADARARAALERVGARRSGEFRPSELDGAEAVRVVLARALVFRPKLLVIDEPTLGVDLLARDEILALLRSLADDGIAILTSTDRATGFSGADRGLALSDGELRGGVVPQLAPVVLLRRPA